MLSLDELKGILNAPALTETPSSSGRIGGGDEDAKADPPECAGAVAAGLDTVYDNSGATGYTRVGYSDPRTATLVDQVAASFALAADAQDFVNQSAGQWRQCCGEVLQHLDVERARADLADRRRGGGPRPRRRCRTR